MNNTNNSNLLVKQQRLTKAERLGFSLTAQLKGILAGLLLGDLYIAKTKTNVNPWLHFKQSTVHEDYLIHLYELFKIYCPSGPKLKIGALDKRTGKSYSSIYFQTYCLPCFIELQELFYVAGKKVVPLNIGDLLTIEGLCYWICDDGYWQGNGVHLCTDSFTIEEINLLAKTLTENFNLECTLNKKNNSFRIRISSGSMPKLQSLLAPHMPSMMRYKIGL